MKKKKIIILIAMIVLIAIISIFVMNKPKQKQSHMALFLPLMAGKRPMGGEFRFPSKSVL